MTDEDLALTHIAAFGEGKGWSATDFASFLADPSTLIEGDAQCFVVVRLAGPEAEILTLATHPSAQRQGRAFAVMTSALAHMVQVGVQEVFLEVSAENAAARGLYDRLGFAPYLTRQAY